MNNIPACVFVVLVLTCNCKSKKEEANPELPKTVSLQKNVSMPETVTTVPGTLPDPADQANQLITEIRDNLILKQTAEKKLNDLLLAISADYYRNGGKDYAFKDWVFPLKGYNRNSIGGQNGNGFIPGGYDFFDGNRHKGHPAQDIFIQDRNQDCLDDRTGKEVPVLSSSGGVVISVEKKWDSTGALRGGKYIWVYDPFNRLLVYYAHNNTVNVSPGQTVVPGQVIASCGRTGLNAFKKRSPTHLHFMVLKLDEKNYPNPVNAYNYLLQSRL